MEDEIFDINDLESDAKRFLDKQDLLNYAEFLANMPTEQEIIFTHYVAAPVFEISQNFHLTESPII